MPTIVKEITTRAPFDEVWSALRAVDQLHTRLVAGFVVDTVMTDQDMRVVTFADGNVVHERIVAIDDEHCRVVWTVEGGVMRHHNGAAQATAECGRTRVVWTADFLPAEVGEYLDVAMSAGMAAMQRTLDQLAPLNTDA